jgi:hypothetical protein
MNTWILKYRYLLAIIFFVGIFQFVTADDDDVDSNNTVSDEYDLYDRNEEQADYNPYDFPSSIEPNNTQSIYWPEVRRLVDQGAYNDLYRSYRHSAIPEMQDKSFHSRRLYSPYDDSRNNNSQANQQNTVGNQGLLTQQGVNSNQLQPRQGVQNQNSSRQNPQQNVNTAQNYYQNQNSYYQGQTYNQGNGSSVGNQNQTQAGYYPTNQYDNYYNQTGDEYPQQYQQNYQQQYYR